MAHKLIFDASAVKSEFEAAGINPKFIPIIWKHVLRSPNCRWDEIPSLPVAAYSLLGSKFKPSTSTLHSAVDSIDGVTTKLLIKLKLLRLSGQTMCSSQLGCNLCYKGHYREHAGLAWSRRKFHKWL